MNRILLAAHPDDEILFLFPFLGECTKMIACVNDKTHPTRKWCDKRSEAFHEVGEILGVETKVLKHDSGFFRKPHRELTAFVEEVRDAIKDADVIYTHNSWGEYSHFDHILINQIARQSGKPMFTTDICMTADWYVPISYTQGKDMGRFEADNELIKRCLAFYSKFGAMRWSYPIIRECNIIKVA